MHVLVTGGAGFLGSHLVDRLLATAGNKVTVVDNLSTGSQANLASALNSGRAELIIGDVLATPDRKYDQIFHLASPASPTAYGRMKVDTLRTNAEGTRRCLEIAAEHGSTFLLASTSEVYGDPLQHPQRETYWGNVNPIGPRSQYDEGKRYAEALTFAYVDEHGVDARIVRIFNSYGPRMQVGDGRMPSTFIAAALTGAPIEVHGDGAQTRSLCFVSDTVRGLTAAMNLAKRRTVYNIGNPRELSVLSFAKRVKKVTLSSSPIVLVAPRAEEIARRRPSIAAARRDLGWTPKITLDVGLARTVRWHRRHH